MEYKNFTSLPPQQEQSFVVYERTSKEAGKKAMTLGYIAGGIILVFTVILFISVPAGENVHAAENETDLKAEKIKAVDKETKPAAVAPEPAAVAPEPAAVAPEPAAVAPEPPKGATKAPPTDLVQ